MAKLKQIELAVGQYLWCTNRYSGFFLFYNECLSFFIFFSCVSFNVFFPCIIFIFTVKKICTIFQNFIFFLLSQRNKF